MVAGGTIERWAVLSTNTLPGDPCDLVTLAKCKVILRSEPVEETVFWIGCDGVCKRWFHSICLNMSGREVNAALRLKKWYCRRPDCKNR